MIKPSIQLKLGQQLTMTPQLQQAIRLLQLSTLELKSEIQEALDSNMMLEIEEPAEVMASAEKAETDQEVKVQDNIPEELPVDANWEDQYDIPVLGSRSSNNDEGHDFLARETAPQSLHDYLHWQLNLTPFSEQDRAIATALIDGIDDDGYLRVSIEEIVADLGDEAVTEAEVLTVLHRLQHFDPPGIAARSPQECLLLQLEQLPSDTPFLQPAIRLLEQHFDLLTSANEQRIGKLLKLSGSDVHQVFRLIRSLNPHPGAEISPLETRYIEPDVYVRKLNDRWQVSLNPNITPKIRINSAYAALINQGNGINDEILKDHLQEARWFLKSLQGRNETLLKVASKIVEFQQAFFEHGEEAMKPLILKDIAKAVDMHESTISRITTGKYMHTPQGVLEFKFFFSSNLSTQNGTDASATAIRARIRKLILAEDPKKPLSDNKIATLLSQEGIKVARRTVAKYRESMAIPPSNERRRLV